MSMKGKITEDQMCNKLVQKLNQIDDFKLSLNNIVKNNIVIENKDFNDITTPGLYTVKMCQNNPSPTGGYGYFSLLVLNSFNDSYVHQIAMKHGTTEIFIRYLQSTWSNWEKLNKSTSNSKYEEIASTNLYSKTEVIFNNIPSKYKKLKLQFDDVSCRTIGGGNLSLFINDIIDNSYILSKFNERYSSGDFTNSFNIPEMIPGTCRYSHQDNSDAYFFGTIILDNSSNKSTVGCVIEVFNTADELLNNAITSVDNSYLANGFVSKTNSISKIKIVFNRTIGNGKIILLGKE